MRRLKMLNKAEIPEIKVLSPAIKVTTKANICKKQEMEKWRKRGRVEMIR